MDAGDAPTPRLADERPASHLAYAQTNRLILCALVIEFRNCWTVVREILILFDHLEDGSCYSLSQKLQYQVRRVQEKVPGSQQKGSRETVFPIMSQNESKLFVLRGILAAQGLDALIVGSGDAHSSEYVADKDLRRSFISDFTGSAGTALILSRADTALLWTDGRYFLQATQELSDKWTLMKSGEPGVLEMPEWLTNNMPANSIVGVDSSLMTDAQGKALTTTLASKGISLVPTQLGNPIDAVWNTVGGGTPAPPIATVMVHDAAGQSHESKIAAIQTKLRTTTATALVLSMLDEIVWLFNIRGADVEYNPVVLSYAVVTLSGAHLFIDKAKLTDEVVHHLGPGVEVHPYEAIEDFLVGLGQTVAVDPSQLNWRLSRAIGPEKTLHMVSPVTLAKACKNETELAGIRAAHIRDGAALTAFLHWLEQTVKAEPGSITEYDVAVKIEEFRKKVPHHVSPSFSTIAGYAQNGAVIHYKPEFETAAPLGTDSLFLLDSGAQYHDGTTDVTRTLHFGAAKATPRMRDCYTLVLKGHIALARAVFPEGTVGSRIDALARMALWSQGLDYNHGTGHGVGAFLNVHEGPQGIGFRKRENEVGFYIGMTSSNEPGYYEEGCFGIRIENVCITVKADTPNNFNGKTYCAFETVTMTPIKTDLINMAMLDDAELAWLNNYHLQVRTKLEPVVKEFFPDSLQYLLQETQHLVRA